MDWENLKMLLEIVLAVILITTLVITPIVGIGLVIQKNYCSTLEILNPNYQFYWSFWVGCLVKIDNVYMDVDYINKTRQEIELNSK